MHRRNARGSSRFLAREFSGIITPLGSRWTRLATDQHLCLPSKTAKNFRLFARFARFARLALTLLPPLCYGRSHARRSLQWPTGPESTLPRGSFVCPRDLPHEARRELLEFSRIEFASIREIRVSAGFQAAEEPTDRGQPNGGIPSFAFYALQSNPNPRARCGIGQGT